MTGWKTWAAGIGSILGGLAIIVNGVANGTYNNMMEGYGMIIGGLAVLGIGHKIEKAAQP